MKAQSQAGQLLKQVKIKINRSVFYQYVFLYVLAAAKFLRRLFHKYDIHMVVCEFEYAS